MEVVSCADMKVVCCWCIMMISMELPCCQLEINTDFGGIDESRKTSAEEFSNCVLAGSVCLL